MELDNFEKLYIIKLLEDEIKEQDDYGLKSVADMLRQTVVKIKESID